MSESVPNQQMDRTDYVRSWRRALEAPKEHLPYLEKNDEYIMDPTQMAETLKEAWEPIWRGRDIPNEVIDGYLGSYQRG